MGGGGLCSFISSKGLRSAKNNSPAANQRETGSTAEMFVVVRLFWLQQAVPCCTGGKGLDTSERFDQ